jgi:hypothetical protein
MDDKIRKPVEGEMFIESPDAMQQEYEKLRPLRFALAFGTDPSMLSRMIGQANMTLAQAQELLDMFAKMYADAYSFVGRYGHLTDLRGRRRHFNVPFNEPSTRFDPKPPQTTTCGQCHTDCTHWDIGPRRWYCNCKQTSIIANDDYPPILKIDFGKANPRTCKEKK